MSILGKAKSKIEAIFLHRRVGRDMRAEMDAHIELATLRLMARGMSRESALHEARKEFGNVAELRERGRDARGARWVGDFAGDVHYALRQFRRAPGGTLTIMLILMLGVTVNASTFAFVDAIVNKPAPGVPNDPNLVTIRGKTTNGSRAWEREYSWTELAEYAGMRNVFEDVAGWTSRGVVVSFRGEEDETSAQIAHFVTPNYFNVARIGFIGPGFQQSRFDEHSTPELNAVISSSLATEKFGSSNAAIGKSFTVNTFTVTVAGVAPPRFAGMGRSQGSASIWLPLSSWRVVDTYDGDPFSNIEAGHFTGVARLRQDVTAEQATALTQPVATRIQQSKQATVADQTMLAGVEVIPVRGDLGDFESRSQLLPMVSALGVIVLLILLVCTATVSSLLIAAASRRRNEIAVRLALGASRLRIVRQLLTETALLSIVAASLGLLLFAFVVRVYEHRIPDVTLTPGVATVAFTTFIAIAAAVLSGLSPALHATRHSLNEVLKDGAAGATSRSRLQRMFVVTQVALAQPLLVCLAVFVVAMVQDSAPSSDAKVREQLIVAALGIEQGQSSSELQMVDAVEQRLEALPDVVSVTRYPQTMALFMLETQELRLQTDTLPQTLPMVGLTVTGDYFETMGISLVKGRTFRDDDRSGRNTPVIITSSMASALFPGQDALGRRIRLARDAGDVEIIGVVSGQADPADKPVNNMHDFRPAIYAPDSARVHGLLMIRTNKSAEPFLPSIRALIADAAPRLPVRQLETIAQIDRKERSELLRAMGAAAGAGIIVLLLAAAGLYALVAMSVSQRRREIGIRVTVGARTEQIVRMFLMRGIRLTVVGLLIGLPLGVVGLYSFLAKIEGLEVAPFLPIAVLISAVVLAVAALASWLPARRAAKVDPVVALRST